MPIPNPRKLSSIAADAFLAIGEWCQNLPSFDPATLPPERTAVALIDLINGFAKEGAMASARVDRLCAPVADAARRLSEQGIPLLAFADCHAPQSPEFDSYPPHCLAETPESELTEEFDGLPVTAIPKQSTNGAIEPAFQAWLDRHLQVENFLLMGDCTDICVLQFALTLKALFTRQNRRVRIVVPLHLTDTFDAPGHDADLYQAIAAKLMANGGIEIVGRLLLNGLVKKGDKNDGKICRG